MNKKILGLIFITHTSFASDLPTVNLGLSSFVDGAVPAGSGWYAQTYFQNYRADSIRDTHGNKIALPQSEIDYQSIVQQISYMSDIKLG
ncbi:MAG: phenol degradation protein meta, partial [Acinetobacter sp.]|nr:phenol degradation protein meta [Acinetobacter sp.]